MPRKLFKGGNYSRAETIRGNTVCWPNFAQYWQHILSWHWQRNFFKVNSVQETCTKSFAVHLLKFEILQTTWNKQNKRHQKAKSVGEKRKTKGLMFFVFIFFMWFARFQIWYVNRKAFGTSFMYWVDFNVIRGNLHKYLWHFHLLTYLPCFVNVVKERPSNHW